MAIGTTCDTIAAIWQWIMVGRQRVATKYSSLGSWENMLGDIGRRGAAA